ncbi:sialate O-acetylesterase [soil metagenome]
MKRFACLGLVLSCWLSVEGHQSARADVTLPSIFSDHMVLQRDHPAKVWGWAEPGEEVTVRIGEQSRAAKADEDGRWSLALAPLTAGGPHTLTVEGQNTITFEDVLVGEVWVCSGQSNMQWSVAASHDADLESLSANYPEIRLLQVPRVGTQEPQADFEGSWKVCTPETVPGFSAVGYFFGRQLHQTLGVPVGLIDNSWGGSSAEAWVRRDLLAADEENYGPLLARWEQIEENFPEAKARFEKERAAHREAASKARADGQQPPRPPQDPEAQMTGQHRPGNLYNGVLKPIIGYGIRGVIWYQGESNASRAYQYRELFPLLIQSWRDDWDIGDFPFYWVQLADFRAESPEPAESDWAELREAQTMTMDRLPNTGEAVIIDLGEAQDIHPRNKQDVAKRLARWALANDYGIDVSCKSPTYDSMEKQGDKILLTFKHVGEGLKAFDVPEIKGFTIAGSDRKFHQAEARIVNAYTVEIRSKAVPDPVAARYAWADNPVCNLYSREGLPVIPFRTDNWPGVTAESR